MSNPNNKYKSLLSIDFIYILFEFELKDRTDAFRSAAVTAQMDEISKGSMEIGSKNRGFSA